MCIRDRFQVVAYVGHAVKMNQVVFAVADDGQNLLAMRGSKTAVQMLGLTFLVLCLNILEVAVSTHLQFFGGRIVTNDDTLFVHLQGY